MHEGLALWGGVLPLRHPCRLVQMRVFPEIAVRQLNDIGTTRTEFPALVGFLDEIQPQNLRANVHRFGMLAGQNQATFTEEARRFDSIPNAPGLGFVGNGKGPNRTIRQVNSYNELGLGETSFHRVNLSFVKFILIHELARCEGMKIRWVIVSYPGINTSQ